MNAIGLKVTTPSDLEIVMTRTFNAPRQLIWEAMTRPELMQRWMFTPPQWSWSRCEMDLRVGGKFHWEWAGPDGRHAMTISGVHKEVTPPARIIHTERMEMGPGAGPCGSECGEGGAEGGGDPWELLATIDLTESAGRTHLTMTLRFPSKQARDAALASGMEQGVAIGYDRLAAMLAAK
jgi:uncharacterized protein YndB with AHSA1/START domain